MVPAVFVIDDFLRNAEEVRRQALALDYMIGGRYPGLNSKQKLRIEGLDEIVSMLVREPVRAPWTNDFSHGSCRIALASSVDSPWMSRSRTGVRYTSGRCTRAPTRRLRIWARMTWSSAIADQSAGSG